MSKISKALIKSHIKEILTYIGEDPNREGLVDTPDRILRSFEELYKGYKEAPENVLSTSFQEGSCNEMVVLKDIEFSSMCEHHVLPFIGKVSIGYIPNEKVLGISKLARIVDVYAKRLQIQEKLTSQIADAIMKYAEAKGVMVVIEAQHMCMVIRGVKKQNSIMQTSAIRGAFKKNKVRNEFLTLIGN